MSEPTMTEYGVYDVTDSLNFSLPGYAIKIGRIGENAFSYTRQDSAGCLVEKMIPSESGQIRVEIAPIRPLNHPARRTGHMYLEFDQEIYLGEGSAASIYVHCPLEVGVFLAGESGRDSLDWITCNQGDSRFGLYGPPDTGILCKYARVSLATGYSDSESYVNGVMRIIIENTLKSGQAVRKVVFPITDNSIYYEGSKAIFDGMRVTLKRRASVSVADIKIAPAETDWTKSPAWEDTTVGTATEMGLE